MCNDTAYIRFTLLRLGAVFNLISKCYRMPPIRKSERQRARSAAALGRPPHGDRVEPIRAPGSSAAPPAAPVAPRAATHLWEADVERRLEATEQLHHEMRVMREMLRVALQQVNPTSDHDAVASASVDRQVAASSAVTPLSHPVVRPASAVGRQVVAPAAPAPVPSTSGQVDILSASSARQAATSVAPEPVPSSSRQDTGMVDHPWPTTDRLMETSTDLPVPGIVDALNILPGATQERVSSFVLPTLFLHAHVPEKTRAKVWSGDFVDVATLLPETSLFQPNYALTIRPGEDGNPAFCVAPTSRTVIRSFPQWSKAFQIYMSVFLLKPENVQEAAKMLKYMQTVINLSERGSNWRGYDESFRCAKSYAGVVLGFSELRIVAERGTPASACVTRGVSLS